MPVSLNIRVQTDYNQNGTYAHALDDLSALVLKASWRYGMDTPRGVIAPPATAELVLNNSTGRFNYDYRGAELITNGDFAAWTAGSPDSWTIVTSSAGVREVTQVEADQTHGGTGTGAANIFRSSGAVVRMRQKVLAANTTYLASMDVTAIGSSNVAGVQFSTSEGASAIYQTVGHKEWIFRNTAATNFEVINYPSTNCDVTIDNVSLVAVADYAWLQPGLQMDIWSDDAYGIGLRTTFWRGRVKQITPNIDPNGTVAMGKSVTVLCECPTADLMMGEYSPPLLLNATIDEAITDLFESGVYAPPYEKNYWLVGVDGSSALGLTTTTAPDVGTVAALDVGSDTFAYLGDTSDRGSGVSPLSYIQDLVAAEMGRFYWNARTNMFFFQSRNNDTMDITSLWTLDSDVYTSVSLAKGDSLFNQFGIRYQVRSIGAANSVVWTLDDVPMQLPAGESRDMDVRYVDPNDENTQVAVSETRVTPVAGTDYTATANEDGTGADMTGNITMAVEWNATSAKIVFSNSSATADAYIQLAQLRATPLYATQDTVRETDGASRALYNLKPHPDLDIRAVGSEDHARNMALYYLRLYSTPTLYTRMIRFRPSHDAATAAIAYNADIGSHFTLLNSATGHNQDYILVGESATLDGMTRVFEMEWLLKPQSRETFWLLGEAGYSELGDTTLIGF